MNASWLWAFIMSFFRLAVFLHLFILRRVAAIEAACTSRTSDWRPLTRSQSVTSPSRMQQQAPNEAVPLTITKLTKKLRDREDEIFQLWRVVCAVSLWLLKKLSQKAMFGLQDERAYEGIDLRWSPCCCMVMDLGSLFTLPLNIDHIMGSYTTFNRLLKGIFLLSSSICCWDIL